MSKTDLKGNSGFSVYIFGAQYTAVATPTLLSLWHLFVCQSVNFSIPFHFTRNAYLPSPWKIHVSNISW